MQLAQYLYAKEQQEGYYTAKKRYFMKRLGMIDPKKEARIAKGAPDKLGRRPSALARAKAKAAALSHAHVRNYVPNFACILKWQILGFIATRTCAWCTVVTLTAGTLTWLFRAPSDHTAACSSGKTASEVLM